jgi:hypothetical protein
VGCVDCVVLDLICQEREDWVRTWRWNIFYLNIRKKEVVYISPPIFFEAKLW